MALGERSNFSSGEAGAVTRSLDERERTNDPRVSADVDDRIDPREPADVDDRIDPREAA